MTNLIHILRNKIEHRAYEYRATMKPCHRCQLLHSITLLICPHCHHLSDEEVAQLASTRSQNRMFVRQTALVLCVVLTLLLTLLYLAS